VVNDLDAAAANAVADQIGGFAVPADAATEQGVNALLAQASELLGRVDTYVANAGVATSHGLDSSEAEWAQSFEVNVMAHVRAARHLIPRWLDGQGGRLVVTASAAGLLTMVGSAPYSVSKHAAVAFAEWLSVTYRHRGIAVHAICPQGVNTDLLSATGAAETLLRSRAIEPEAVADALVRAIADETFLVLPHPEVGTYYSARATDTERWLDGMNRIQRSIEGL
jgi:NAD(P)-dependent dehydrogenase (short-subunit alcohol dehydrogenase family)